MRMLGIMYMYACVEKNRGNTVHIQLTHLMQPNGTHLLLVSNAIHESHGD